MKGIKCCAECADYSLKKHKCMGGAKDPGKASDSFYADCPLVDAQPLRHGRWIPVDGEPYAKCSYCGEKHYGCSTPYCDMCGAYMRKDGADNG